MKSHCEVNFYDLGFICLCLVEIKKGLYELEILVTVSETRRSLPNLSRMAYPQGLQTFSRNRETHNRDNSLGRARETSLGRTRDTSVGRTRDTSLGRTRDSSLGRTRDSSLGRNVTRQPGSGARQASPARAMSPSRPGIPVARSSIPRPGSASRLPTPKKYVVCRVFLLASKASLLIKGFPYSGICLICQQTVRPLYRSALYLLST